MVVRSCVCSISKVLSQGSVRSSGSRGSGSGPAGSGSGPAGAAEDEAEVDNFKMGRVGPEQESDLDCEVTAIGLTLESGQLHTRSTVTSYNFLTTQAHLHLKSLVTKCKQYAACRECVHVLCVR